jgi:hypothetical protein
VEYLWEAQQTISKMQYQDDTLAGKEKQQPAKLIERHSGV